MSPCPKMYRSLRYEYLHDRFCRVRVISVGYWMLDVLTPLSDCIHESVEKMEWRISGGSYMYWMDFHNGILCCGFLCARLISVSFSGSLLQRGLPRPTALFSGYHVKGYHARTDAIKLTGYHVCRVTTPELPRSKQTSGYRQVITPAGSFYIFFLSSVIRQCSITTSPPSLAHTARTHSTSHLHKLRGILRSCVLRV